jgi:hypothetical protein
VARGSFRRRAVHDTMQVIAAGITDGDGIGDSFNLSYVSTAGDIRTYSVGGVSSSSGVFALATARHLGDSVAITVRESGGTVFVDLEISDTSDDANIVVFKPV